jgi:hypothetical protein
LGLGRAFRRNARLPALLIERALANALRAKNDGSAVASLQRSRKVFEGQLGLVSSSDLIRKHS